MNRTCKCGNEIKWDGETECGTCALRTFGDHFVEGIKAQDAIAHTSRKDAKIAARATLVDIAEMAI